MDCDPDQALVLGETAQLGGEWLGCDAVPPGELCRARLVEHLAQDDDVAAVALVGQPGRQVDGDIAGFTEAKRSPRCALSEQEGAPVSGAPQRSTADLVKTLTLSRTLAATIPLADIALAAIPAAAAAGPHATVSRTERATPAPRGRQS